MYRTNRYKHTENIISDKRSISTLPNMKLTSNSQDTICLIPSPSVNMIKEPTMTTPAISPALLPPSLEVFVLTSDSTTMGVLLMASHTCDLRNWGVWEYRGCSPADWRSFPIDDWRRLARLSDRDLITICQCCCWDRQSSWNHDPSTGMPESYLESVISFSPDVTVMGLLQAHCHEPTLH